MQTTSSTSAMHFDEVARLDRLRDELSSAWPQASGDAIERAIVDTIHEIVLTETTTSTSPTSGRDR